MPGVSSVRAFLVRLRNGIEGPEGPPIAWTLRGYRASQRTGDIVAGLTVAALIVPLSIGYAGVAGLPPEAGLYASLAPLLLYAIFGSARRLVIGPDASTAALIGATLIPLAATSDDRVRLASMLGLIVAAVFVAMRLGRMGFLADFLSRPILVGYLTGVGITVAVGQVEKILGGPAISDAFSVLARIDWIGADPRAVIDAVSLAVTASGAELLSLVIGGSVVAAMLVARRVAPRIPIALLAMIVALIASAAFDLQALGVTVLGPVASGLPSISMPYATPTELVGLIPGALGLAVLSFADTTVTGRSFAARHGERTDANRELVALAAADAAGGVTGGYPVSSSPSRTSAAEAAGSTSQMTGVIAAAAVAVVLVLLTGPLAYLPIPALGGVILVAVLGLIDVVGIRSIWALKRSEGLIALTAVGGVILYGTLTGVVIAVLLAALNIVRRSAWPEIVEEGRLPDGKWRDPERSDAAVQVEGVLVLRFGGPLFFANVGALEARIREAVASRPGIRVVILDLAATADIDLSAGQALSGVAESLERDGRRLAVAEPIGRVRDELRAYGLERLMAPSGGTHGSVDAVIVGAGLDPLRPMREPTPQPAAPTPPDADVPSETTRTSADRVAWQTVGGAAVAVVLAVGIAAVLAAWGLGPGTAPNEAPNLIGMSLERASAAAEDAGFELAPPIYTHRADRPENTVVDQVPAPGTPMDAGSAIQPIVGTGRQLVIVPDVIGQTEAQAIATLTASGLTVRRTGTVEDDSVPAGSLVATTPAAGTSVGSGTVVSYEVSSGPAATPMPTASPTVAASGAPEPVATPTPTVAPSMPTPTADAPSASPSGPRPSASPDASPSASTAPPSPSPSP